MSDVTIIMSCDHAAGHVPGRFRHLFAQHPDVLRSPRAYDIGARDLARDLARQLHCPLKRCGITRLLIEPQHSQRHRLFSEYTQDLEESEKQHLIATYYVPYRSLLFQEIKQHLVQNRTVIHLALGSFPPERNGEDLDVDIALLYDPQRQREKDRAEQWQAALQEQTDWHIRRNYPERGTADRLTTWLRHRFPPEAYQGLGIAINQALLGPADNPPATPVGAILADVLATNLAPVPEIAGIH